MESVIVYIRQNEVIVDFHRLVSSPTTGASTVDSPPLSIRTTLYPSNIATDAQRLSCCVSGRPVITEAYDALSNVDVVSCLQCVVCAVRCLVAAAVTPDPCQRSPASILS